MGWNHAVESTKFFGGGLSSAYILVSDEDRSIQMSATHGIPNYRSQADESHGNSADVRLIYQNSFVLGKVYREFELVERRTSN